MGGNPKVAIFVPPELRLGSEAPWKPTTSSIVALPDVGEGYSRPEGQVREGRSGGDLRGALRRGQLG